MEGNLSDWLICCHAQLELDTKYYSFPLIKFNKRRFGFNENIEILSYRNTIDIQKRQPAFIRKMKCKEEKKKNSEKDKTMNEID